MDPLEDSALEGDITFHFVPIEGMVIVTIDTGAVKFAGDIGYAPPMWKAPLWDSLYSCWVSHALW